MIIAVDFDGTLALGNYSHISLLEPNRDLIHRLQELQKTIDPTIKIVTARGGKGLLSEEQKRERYLFLIESWLWKYDVPYHEISFNKEYANLYIDDQTIQPFDEFQGITSKFTRSKIIFTQNTVIKNSPTALFEFEWYKQARTLGLNVPDVAFCNDECIITEYTPPTRATTAQDFITLCNQFIELRPFAHNSYQTYLHNIEAIDKASDKTNAVVNRLPSLSHAPTFYHGDLSTSNVLATEDSTYLIDPNSKHVFGSYLTDAGKAAFSLIAYEQQFDQAQLIFNTFPDSIAFAVAEGLRVCKYRPEYISIVNNIAACGGGCSEIKEGGG